MISDQVHREIERVLLLADPLLEAVQTAMEQGLVPRSWSQEKWERPLSSRDKRRLKSSGATKSGPGK